MIGEAAGFISASSLEGISYALDSAEALKSVLLRDAPDMNHAYRKATRKLRLKLFGKILKSRALTSAFSRKWIMRSGVAHIPQGDHSVSQLIAETGQMRQGICP